MPVLAGWAAILAVGFLASLHLSPLLADVFTVPGTDSDRARVILQRDFGERPDGVFTVVFRAPRVERAAMQRRLDTAAKVVPDAHASRISVGSGVLYGEIDSTLNLQQAKGYT